MKWNIKARLRATSPKKRQEEILEKVLSNRKIDTQDRKIFLSPPHPSKLSLAGVGVEQSQIKKAISLIKKHAKQKDRPIVVYGDYDADGITATAILWETLHRSGIKAMPFIPSRAEHGYGLSVAGLNDVISKHHPSLVVTVDNGITAIDEATFAKKQGLDLIIVDHHEKTGKKHPATAILHTKQVSGSGLSWLFAKELSEKLSLTHRCERTLELAAIGTVADLVPLVGPSRSIVKYGIDALRRTKRIGIKSLIDIASIKQEDVDTYHIGFQIAPRLNAMGRLETAIDSLRLLCTSNEMKAKNLARQLNETNRLRQDMTEEMTELARTLAKRQKGSSAIILTHKSFHEGIIGLVAGKIAQEFWRPTIILSKGKEFSKASGRSIPGFNLINALRIFDHLFENVGGHYAAAGFTIHNNNSDKFTTAFQELSAKLLTDDLLTPTLMVDAEIKFSDVTHQLMNALTHFHPFGIGNPRQVFSTTGVTVKNARVVGAEGKHLKLFVEKDGKEFSAIGFNMGSMIHNLSSNVSIAYTPELSTWNGRSSIQLKLKDLHLSQSLS